MIAGAAGAGPLIGAAGAGPLIGTAGAGPLIGTARLAGLVGSAEPPALLDVRWRLGGPPGTEAYRAGHLPGARYVDLDSELAGPPGSGDGGRHPLPGAGVFQAAMRRAGLRTGQLAVAYDDGDSLTAGRLWWLLRYFGHRRAAVLDGGLRAWAAAGLPVTAEVTQPPPGDFAAGPGGGMPVLDDAGAARLARTGLLLDARAAARYRGETEPVDKAAGHIPGAISAPATANVAEDGTFLPPGELTRLFAGLGLPPGDGGRRGCGCGGASPQDAPQVGVYCGSGVTAAQEVLALELAGRTAALYVGSWSAWCADPSRPVATGPDPG